MTCFIIAHVSCKGVQTPLNWYRTHPVTKTTQRGKQPGGGGKVSSRKQVFVIAVGF